MADTRVEKVARVLCALDGVEPDTMSEYPGSVRLVMNNPEAARPRWQEYATEARKFVAVHDALVG